MDTGIVRTTEEEALRFHSSSRPGELSIEPHKPLVTQPDPWPAIASLRSQ